MDTLIFFCTMFGLLPIYVREWRKKIRIYSIVMTILGISLITFGILTLTDTYTADEIFSYMKIMWTDQNVNSTKVEAEQFWNNVQMEYKCCGLNSFYNYNITLPVSCCANDLNHCTIDNAYKSYCFDAVRGYHQNVLVIILSSVAFSISFVCVVFIITAQFSMRIFVVSHVSENVSVL